MEGRTDAPWRLQGWDYLIESGGDNQIYQNVVIFSPGIKYSNQEYTPVGYPILGYFRVQEPKNLWKTDMIQISFRMAWKFSSKLGT